MPQMRVLLRRLIITATFFLGHFYVAAHAFEGDLILPDTGKSTVVFELLDGQPDIDPSLVFKVFVGKPDACCVGKSPMAGRYAIDKRTVTFYPAFDFIEGQNYTVEVSNHDASINRIRYLKPFTIARTNADVWPEIIAIFPSGNDIPENTLRFYIHFSSPMQPHVSADYIKLVNQAGTPDTAAFMAFKQELWSEDRKRLTLLMDPGRIKRGVAQNLTLGPALLEGRMYSIVVEKGWSTADGTKKTARFEKAFTVSKALRTLPNTLLWSITSPRKETNDPLIIKFDRPFDYELLQHGISVLGEGGETIRGAISVEKHEQIWRFDPKGNWRNSQIQIAVDTQLEDVAGNNFIDLLDHLVGTEALPDDQKLISLNLEASPN